MKKLLGLVAFITVIVACDSTTIRFKQAQPLGEADIETVPKSLWGTYFSKEDSSYLDISEVQLKEKRFIGFTIHRDSISESELSDIGISPDNLTQDTVINTNYEGAQIDLEIVNNIINLNMSGERVIFDFNQGHILRNRDNIFFLNTRESSDNLWQLWTVHNLGDSLLINKSIASLQLNTFKEITTVDSILSKNGAVINYVVNPGLDELARILKESETNNKSYIRTN